MGPVDTGRSRGQKKKKKKFLSIFTNLLSYSAASKRKSNLPRYVKEAAGAFITFLPLN